MWWRFGPVCMCVCDSFTLSKWISFLVYLPIDSFFREATPVQSSSLWDPHWTRAVRERERAKTLAAISPRMGHTPWNSLRDSLTSAGGPSVLYNGMSNICSQQTISLSLSLPIIFWPISFIHAIYTAAAAAEVSPLVYIFHLTWCEEREKYILIYSQKRFIAPIWSSLSLYIPFVYAQLNYMCILSSAQHYFDVDQPLGVFTIHLIAEQIKTYCI